MEYSNKSASYTLEQSRSMIQRQDGRVIYGDISSLQKALCKGLNACQSDELRRQYKAGLRSGKLTTQFLEAVFPYIPGVLSTAGNQVKFLVFPGNESLPPINPAYTAKVVEASDRREIEKELAEIYVMIDAIDLNSDPFPVDLGEAARWLGYSGEAKAAKNNAKTALLSAGYVEGLDYTRLTIQTRVQGHKGGGAVNVEQIRLTAECFKKFCLKAGTKRAERVREYFILAEQRFRAVFKGEGQNETAIQPSSEITSIAGVPVDLEDVIRRAANEAAAKVVSEVLSGVEIAVKKYQTPAEADLKRLHGSLYQQVLEQSYHYPDGIHCPCCNKPTTSWEVDHWSSKTNPARTNGWKVCRPCNQTLGAAGDNTKRHQYKSRFDAFQVRCDDFEQYLKGDEQQLGLL